MTSWGVDWIIGLFDWKNYKEKNGMKSFLKKLGLALFNFAKAESPIGEFLSPFFKGSSNKVVQEAGVVLGDITQMSQQAVTIETALQGQSGTAKLTALIPLVGNIVKSSEAIAGKKIANEDLFTKAVQEDAQATVDLLNSLGE